jgi:hypothetical protein
MTAFFKDHPDKVQVNFKHVLSRVGGMALANDRKIVL